MTYKTAVLFADSNRGVYIPQHFAESANRDQFKYISDSDYNELLKGPESEFYWETWESVLNNAETIDGRTLYQDGDLWIVDFQGAIDTINEAIADQLEYEESHIDAGDNYSHCVSESWCSSQENRLLEQMEEQGVDCRGLDIDKVSDLALQWFEMEPGHMFSMPKGIVLDSFHLQEIEVELDYLEIDHLTLDLVSESTDYYISGTGLAYATSDAVWFAVISPKTLQTAIDEEVDN